MKYYLAILLSLFFFSGFSQKLECCHTVEEVKNTLEGNWKEKDSSSKIIYNFWFSDKSGGMDEMEESNGDGEYIALTCQPSIRVFKKKKKFKIEFTYMLEVVTYDILELNTQKLFFKNKNSKMKYEKIN